MARDIFGTRLCQARSNKRTEATTVNQVPQTFQCRTCGAAVEFKYQPDEGVGLVREARRMDKKPSGTVTAEAYLECENGHVHRYDVEIPE